MENLYRRTKKTLAAARDHYGYNNQLLVAIEELNELSCLLAKYPRYNSHTLAVKALRENVLDECADVFNVMDHIQAIFGISDDEIVEACGHKGDRLLHWMRSSGMQITTEEREVPNSPCFLCERGPICGSPDRLSKCNAQNGYALFTMKPRNSEG